MSSAPQREVDAPVHYANGPHAGNIRLVCKIGYWFQYKWGPEGSDKTTDPAVFVANNDLLFTFNTEKVTCDNCNELKVKP